MNSKIKNPLYVVKGDQVEAANSFIDMLVKKLNLEPFVQFMLSIFNMLFEYAKSYSAFMVVKTLFDEFMRRIELFRRFAIL